ncbi:hypothetical protein Pelo_6258 [Pelomyxa schiedti]|nr:hypothetical protein Pelo_6258 [Pelomyxa schiedti]
MVRVTWLLHCCVCALGLLNCGSAFGVLVWWTSDAFPLRVLPTFLTNWGVASAMLHFAMMLGKLLMGGKGKSRNLGWFYYIALSANCVVTIAFWALLTNNTGNLIEQGQNVPMNLMVMMHLIPFVLLLLEPVVGDTAMTPKWSYGTVVAAMLLYHGAFVCVMFSSYFAYGKFPYPFVQVLWNAITNNQVPVLVAVITAGITTVVLSALFASFYIQHMTTSSSRRTTPTQPSAGKKRTKRHHVS